MIERRSQEDRAQVGIGTLIVFIAMVLVAAIAAGVLINTAGFLQTQAEDTGTESTEQVADNLNVITETGNVSDADRINEVRIGVQPASGASDINLARLTLQYVSDDEFANIVVGNDSTTAEDTAAGDANPDNIVAVSGDVDGTVGDRDSGDERYVVNVITAEQEQDIVMTDGADRYEIVVPLAENATTDSSYTGDVSPFFNGDLESLNEGDEVEITITTEAGAQVVAFMQVPDSLAGESTGASINL